MNEYGSTKRVPYNRKLDRYRLDYAIFVKDAIFCSIRISPCTVNIVQFERAQEFSSLSFCFFEEFSRASSTIFSKSNVSPYFVMSIFIS